MDHRGLLALYSLSFRNDTKLTACYEVGSKTNYDAKVVAATTKPSTTPTEHMTTRS